MGQGFESSGQTDRQMGVWIPACAGMTVGRGGDGWCRESLAGAGGKICDISPIFSQSLPFGVLRRAGDTGFTLIPGPRPEGEREVRIGIGFGW